MTQAAQKKNSFIQNEAFSSEPFSLRGNTSFENKPNSSFLKHEESNATIPLDPETIPDIFKREKGSI